MICAAAPPGGGRKELTTRFTRHFNMICLPPTSKDSSDLIFKSILNGYLKESNYKKAIQQMSGSFVDATSDIYAKIMQDLRPTPAKSHYTFNLRDMSKVF